MVDECSVQLTQAPIFLVGPGDACRISSLHSLLESDTPVGCFNHDYDIANLEQYAFVGAAHRVHIHVKKNP